MNATTVPNIVVVDPKFDDYQHLADSARRGRIDLHIRSSGAEALKIAGRRPVDAWIIAPDLDDMSGHDLVELIRGRAADAKVALIEAEGPGSRHRAVAEQDAAVVGADAVLSKPISLLDLEELLGLPLEDRSKILAAAETVGSMVTLPVGVGAAAVSIAVLLLTR